MMHRGERDRAIAATPVTLGGDAAAASGVFAVRKPPAQGCLSTLEAVARALDALEPPPPQGEAPLSHALLRPMLRPPMSLAPSRQCPRSTRGGGQSGGEESGGEES